MIHRLRRAWLLWIALVFVILLPFGGDVSQAHNFNNGYSYVRLTGEKSVLYDLLLPFPVLQAYDSDGDKAISEEELKQHYDVLTSYVITRLQLYNNEQKMDVQPMNVQTIVQELTEDRMVRISLKYTSKTELGNVTILYDLIYDVDDAHQNYIQLFDEKDELLEHWVVQQGVSTVRYTPDSHFRYDMNIVRNYVLSGVQAMLFQPFCWLLLFGLLLISRKQKVTAAALAYGTLYSLVGFLAADKLKVDWLYSVFLIIFVSLLLYCFIRKQLLPASVISSVFGLTWGSSSLQRIAELQLNNRFDLVSLVLYYTGILVAWLGLLYVAVVLVQPLLSRLRKLKS